MKRSLLYIITTASFGVLLMVFGIGLTTNLNSAHAAAPAVQSSELQPAGGAAEFRAEDGLIPSAQAASEPMSLEEVDPGVIGMFGINWKLFLAQLVNFGIVLLVLWKFVWKPVTSGLSERSEKIEQSLLEAQKITEDRLTFDSWKQGEMAEVRKEAAGIITEAKQQAEQLKAETVRATAAEQSRVIEQAQKRLEQEKATMLESAKSELADIVVQATSTILKEKMNPEKDKELISEALKKAQS